MKNIVSIKENRDFRRIYARGRNYADGNLAVYVLKNKFNRDKNRLGLTVSLKLGKAHIRNRIKRRMREVYRLNQHLLPFGYDIILVGRHKTYDVQFSNLESSFKKATSKLIP